MLKKILLTSLVVILTGGLAALYFRFASQESARLRSQVICRGVDIIVMDSLNNRLIGSRDIREILDRHTHTLGRMLDSVNLDAVERLLDSRGEVLKSEVYSRSDGSLCIEIAQRYPAMRFIHGDAGFYADRDGFVFPITNPADVPVVTGAVPLEFPENFKGYPEGDEEKGWLGGMLRLAEYIESHDYWHRQVGQIEIERNGDVVLYLREARQHFIFGDCSDIDRKFRNIALFYKNIAPQEEAEKYTCVNLKFKNQIVCK